MFDSIRHLLLAVYDVQGLIQWGGTFLVCAIIFVETGLFFGFFLPGDSLLVTAGVFAAAHVLNIATLLPLVTLCAICGDQVGYWIGRQAGQALYRREDSLFFKRRHLERAHQFYETYGGKTVILARFMPIVRTFCPPVAGAAGMRYARYLAYDVVGGCVWAGSTILGRLLPGLVHTQYQPAYPLCDRRRRCTFVPARNHRWLARALSPRAASRGAAGRRVPAGLRSPGTLVPGREPSSTASDRTAVPTKADHLRYRQGDRARQPEPLARAARGARSRRRRRSPVRKAVATAESGPRSRPTPAGEIGKRAA